MFVIENVVPTPADIRLTGDIDGIAVEAFSGAAPGASAYTLSGDICYPNDTCVDATASVRLEVLSVATAADSDVPVQGITEPSSDRRTEAVEYPDTGLLALADEAMVVLSADLEPLAAAELGESVAARHGAHVTGGYSDLGIVEMRWPDAGDIESRLTSLTADPDVVSAVPTLLGAVEDGAGPPAITMSGPQTSATSAAAATPVPEDWQSSLGFDLGWPLRNIRAPEAWAITTGRGDTAAEPDGEAVGIVDMGVAQKNYGVWSTNLQSSRTSSTPDEHATHVAGIACASPQAGGNVGVSWRCRTYHTGLINSEWKSVVAAAEELIGRTRVRVVNMSLARSSKGCATANQRADIRRSTEINAPLFDALFSRGRGASVLWTLAAGNNCMASASSPMAKHWRRDNVVTVASTNSDGQLSSFSNFGDGVEIAAPGGVDSSGRPILSTMVPNGSRECPSSCYDFMSGTSMAAPAVAGVAQLLFTAKSGLSANQVGRCIVGSATQKVPSHSNAPSGFSRQGEAAYIANSLEEVDARAAVECGLQQPTELTYSPVSSVQNALDIYGFSGGSRYLAYRTTNYQVAVADLDTGATQVVSVGNEGQPASSQDAGQLSVSDNGRWSVFVTRSSLGAGANGEGQVWLRDTLLGSTTLVSRSATGAANYGAMQPSISGDGRYVSFLSNSTNLNPPPGTSSGAAVAYIYDRLNGSVRGFSATKAGVFNLTMSRDGKWLAFNTRDNLLPNDTDFQQDAYLLNQQSGALRLASPPSAQVTRDVSSPVSLSQDGRYAAYTAFAANVSVAYARDVFIYDTWTDRTVRIRSRAGMWLGGAGISMSGDGQRVAINGLTDVDLPMQPTTSNRILIFDAATALPMGEIPVSSLPFVSINGTRVAYLSDLTAHLVDVPR